MAHGARQNEKTEYTQKSMNSGAFCILILINKGYLLLKIILMGSFWEHDKYNLFLCYNFSHLNNCSEPIKPSNSSTFYMVALSINAAFRNAISLLISFGLIVLRILFPPSGVQYIFSFSLARVIAV